MSWAPRIRFRVKLTGPSTTRNELGLRLSAGLQSDAGFGVSIRGLLASGKVVRGAGVPFSGFFGFDRIQSGLVALLIGCFGQKLSDVQP